jgi:hypothetical protein
MTRVCTQQKNMCMQHHTRSPQPHTGRQLRGMPALTGPMYNMRPRMPWLSSTDLGLQEHPYIRPA